MSTTKSYWSGYKAMTVVDLINKVCAATGSVGLAQSSAHSNYNGHSLSIHFNDRRRYWICEYTWAGRQVVARGEFGDVLSQALLFQENNGSSGSLTVHCETQEQAETCLAVGLKESSMEIQNEAYRKLLPEWVLTEAPSLVHASKHIPIDYSILIQAVKDGLSEKEYRLKVEASRPQSRFA